MVKVNQTPIRDLSKPALQRKKKLQYFFITNSSTGPAASRCRLEAKP